MKTFKDAKERPFQLCLNYGMVQQIQAELSLDLRSPADPTATEDQPKPTLVSRLYTDPSLFVALLMVMVRSQLKDLKDETPENWRDELDADTIGRAREAFFEEWADFFRGLKTGHLAEMMTAEIDLMQRTAKAATAEMAAVDPAAMLREKIASTLTGSSGSGPGSSESTRAA